jgi:hypothetical protein
VTEKTYRKQLTDTYKQNHPQAGVYCIRNTKNNKLLLGSSPNLASVRGKLAFARSTRSVGVLDYRLHQDATQFGLAALAFEVLEVLETKPEMTGQQIRDDLQALEALWREKFEADLLY